MKTKEIIHENFVDYLKDFGNRITSPGGSNTKFKRNDKIKQISKLIFKLWNEKVQILNKQNKTSRNDIQTEAIQMITNVLKMNPHSVVLRPSVQQLVLATEREIRDNSGKMRDDATIKKAISNIVVNGARTIDDRRGDDIDYNASDESHGDSVFREFGIKVNDTFTFKSVTVKMRKTGTFITFENEPFKFYKAHVVPNSNPIRAVLGQLVTNSDLQQEISSRMQATNAELLVGKRLENNNRLEFTVEGRT